MRKIILTSITLLVVLHALAWGPTGHRATGLVAEKYLTKKARKALQHLLQGQSLAMASTWMDEIRSDSSYNFMSDWHWVTVQEGQTYDQSEKNPKGDIIQTIERIVAELKSKKLNREDEVQRIKILLHLIGDIHQPMHVGVGNDRGGNDVKVMWFRSESNLHRIWDSDMIDDSHLSFTELGESLDKPDETKVKALQKASVRDWANESIALRPQVYDYGNGKLGYEYAYKNFPTVRERLLQGAIRLAGVLNEIYR